MEWLGAELAPRPIPYRRHNACIYKDDARKAVSNHRKEGLACGDASAPFRQIVFQREVCPTIGAEV